MFMLVDPAGGAAAVADACHGLESAVVIVKFALMIIQWVVPVILIVLGTIDLVKAVVAGKEEDIKKNQKALMKRIIAAVIVFLIPLIVSILMGWLGQSEWKTCWKSVENKKISEVLNPLDADKSE